jgi:hypothetical protein
MAKYRYTQREWEHLDRICGDINDLAHILRHRRGRAYPCADEQTAAEWERLIAPLLEHLEEVWHESVDMLDGDDIEMEDAA